MLPPVVLLNYTEVRTCTSCAETMLYFNLPHSSLNPVLTRHCPVSPVSETRHFHVVLQSSTIQLASETKHFRHSGKHNSYSFRNRATSLTNGVLQSSTTGHPKISTLAGKTAHKRPPGIEPADIPIRAQRLEMRKGARKA